MEPLVQCKRPAGLDPPQLATSSPFQPKLLSAAWTSCLWDLAHSFLLPTSHPPTCPWCHSLWEVCSHLRTRWGGTLLPPGKLDLSRSEHSPHSPTIQLTDAHGPRVREVDKSLRAGLLSYAFMCSALSTVLNAADTRKASTQEDCTEQRSLSLKPEPSAPTSCFPQRRSHTSPLLGCGVGGAEREMTESSLCGVRSVWMVSHLCAEMAGVPWATRRQDFSCLWIPNPHEGLLPGSSSRP